MRDLPISTVATSGSIGIGDVEDSAITNPGRSESVANGRAAGGRIVRVGEDLYPLQPQFLEGKPTSERDCARRDSTATMPGTGPVGEIGGSGRRGLISHPPRSVA